MYLSRGSLVHAYRRRPWAYLLESLTWVLRSLSKSLISWALRCHFFPDLIILEVVGSVTANNLRVLAVHAPS